MGLILRYRHLSPPSRTSIPLQRPSPYATDTQKEHPMSAETELKCPVAHGGKPRQTRNNAHWWPDQLNLAVLHQHANLGDPMLEDFDYRKEFQTLDLDAV